MGQMNEETRENLRKLLFDLDNLDTDLHFGREVRMEELTTVLLEILTILVET